MTSRLVVCERASCHNIGAIHSRSAPGDDDSHFARWQLTTSSSLLRLPILRECLCMWRRDGKMSEWIRNIPFGNWIIEITRTNWWLWDTSWRSGWCRLRRDESVCNPGLWPEWVPGNDWMARLELNNWCVILCIGAIVTAHRKDFLFCKPQVNEI